MKSSIFVIMKKELARFFGDRRMVIGILMPGVLIYVMYSFMGQAMGESFSVEESYVPTVYAVELPESIGALAGAAGLEMVSVQADQADEIKGAVTDQDCDLLAVFPPDFDAAVAAYDPGSGLPAPQVELYYNSASVESQTAYSAVAALLDGFETRLTNKFDINAGGGIYDLATMEDATGAYFSMLLPLLLMMFLYSGCAAVAPESIAGEKERGTIATMLITPIRRGDIAVGKILALAVMALLSGTSSAVGTILALPKLMGESGGEFSADIYGAGDYLLLAAVILSTVLLLVTLISILSAFAKTVKEAQTYAMPLMILVMVLGVSGMFSSGGASQELVRYFIPLYNSVQCMVGIFSFSTQPAAVGAALAVNGLCTLAGVFLLTRMFHSERVMFSR